jgi:hypothetical protein
VLMMLAMHMRVRMIHQLMAMDMLRALAVKLARPALSWTSSKFLLSAGLCSFRLSKQEEDNKPSETSRAFAGEPSHGYAALRHRPARPSVG